MMKPKNLQKKPAVQRSPMTKKQEDGIPWKRLESLKGKSAQNPKTNGRNPVNQAKPTQKTKEIQPKTNQRRPIQDSEGESSEAEENSVSESSSQNKSHSESTSSRGTQRSSKQSRERSSSSSSRSESEKENKESQSSSESETTKTEDEIDKEELFEELNNISEAFGLDITDCFFNSILGDSKRNSTKSQNGTSTNQSQRESHISRVSCSKSPNRGGNWKKMKDFKDEKTMKAPKQPNLRKKEEGEKRISPEEFASRVYSRFETYTVKRNRNMIELTKERMKETASQMREAPLINNKSKKETREPLMNRVNSIMSAKAKKRKEFLVQQANKENEEIQKECTFQPNCKEKKSKKEPETKRNIVKALYQKSNEVQKKKMEAVTKRALEEREKFYKPKLSEGTKQIIVSVHPSPF